MTTPLSYDDWIVQLHSKYPIVLPESTEVSVGLGWRPMVEEACELLYKYLLMCPSLKFDQIKEKFGQIRLYFSGVEEPYADYIYKQMDDIEARANATCEDCGTTENVTNSVKPGRSWIRTLCEDCRAK